MTGADRITKLAIQRVSWGDEDLEKVLKDNEIEVTNDNLNALVQHADFEKLNETLIMQGFEYLTDIAWKVFNIE